MMTLSETEQDIVTRADRTNAMKVWFGALVSHRPSGNKRDVGIVQPPKNQIAYKHF